MYLATHRRFIRNIALGVLLLNFIVAGMIWFSLHKSRCQYEERVAISTQNITRVFHESIYGAFSKIDIALQSVVDEAERQLATGDIQAESLNRFIVREHVRMPELVALRATNALGDAIYGPKQVPVKTASLAHRDYFKLLRDSSNVGMVISKPLVGGISGKWMIILARRINRPDGTFAGLVYAGLALDYLSQSFSNINIGKHGLVSLLDSDFCLVARYPEPESVGSDSGKKAGSQTLINLVQAGNISGTYQSKSIVDAIERTISFRKIALSQPYYMVVGQAKEDYLTEWYQEVTTLTLFMTLFFVVTFISTWLVYREWHRNEKEVAERQMAQEMLLHKNEELESTLARTNRLEGIISICMNCKKVNNNRESWEQLEKYITENSDARFSHGFCPDCAEIQRKELQTEIDKMKL